MNRCLFGVTQCLVLLLLAMNAPAQAEEQSSGAENFRIYEKTLSDSFYYDTFINLTGYDKVFVFPATYDQWKISDASKAAYRKSWEQTDENELKKVAGFLDEAVRKEFSKSKQFKLTDEQGEKVLAVEFRLKEFSPNTPYGDEALGTIGQSFNLMGLGNLHIQVVVVDSQTRKLVALIDTVDSINSGKYTGAISRSTINRAWKSSFKRIVDNIHVDMKRVKKSSG